MNVRLKIFLFAICLLVLVYLLRKLKTRRADIRYVLPWLGLDLVLAVVTAFPGILDFFCALFGIETPSNMLFFFALLFLAMLVFSMTLTISRQSGEIRELTQRLALWEEKENRTDRKIPDEKEE